MLCYAQVDDYCVRPMINKTCYAQVAHNVIKHDRLDQQKGDCVELNQTDQVSYEIALSSIKSHLSVLPVL
jgi:hypothetical protein